MRRSGSQEAEPLIIDRAAASEIPSAAAIRDWAREKRVFISSAAGCACVADEIVRPLALLLIVDALVGSGRAARVTDFSLGASVRGERQLRLSWESPRRYTGDPPKVRTIAGTVKLS